MSDVSYKQVAGKLDLINRQNVISREFVKIEISYPKFTSKEHKGKPYYAIKYIENGKNCVIGFGTYSIEMLSCYIKKYFIMPSAESKTKLIAEVKMSKEDIQDAVDKAVKKMKAEMEEPEIIRCKDCKFAHMTHDGECKYCDIWFPDEKNYLNGNYYCASAERRTDEQTD